jgi:hypothetical protein
VAPAKSGRAWRSGRVEMARSGHHGEAGVAKLPWPPAPLNRRLRSARDGSGRETNTTATLRGNRIVVAGLRRPAHGLSAAHRHCNHHDDARDQHAHRTLGEPVDGESPSSRAGEKWSALMSLAWPRSWGTRRPCAQSCPRNWESRTGVAPSRTPTRVDSHQKRARRCIRTQDISTVCSQTRRPDRGSCEQGLGLAVGAARYLRAQGIGRVAL